MYIEIHTWFLFLHYYIYLFLKIILDNMFFIIINILKIKTLKFKLKIKWITFCGIHTKIPLIVRKGDHHNVLSPNHGSNAGRP